ncbi:MAG: sugar phosphate isomerase/epimerase family protein [Chloroflexota bacterium]
MKINASSTLLFAYQMEEVFNIAKNLRYDGVEVWHYHLLKSGEDKKCSNLCEMAQQLDLSLSFHALSWDLNFTSKINQVRETSLKLLEESLDLSAELNANPVVIHPGRITIPGDSSEECWQFLIEGIKRLTSYAGQKNLDIALELMEHIPNEFFITPADANRILDEVKVPNLGITFDAAHVPLGDDLLDYISRVNDVTHIHLSDLTSEKRHIALNTGDRDFTELVRYNIDNLQAGVAIEGIEYQRSEWLAKHNIKEMDRIIKSPGTNKSKRVIKKGGGL